MGETAQVTSLIRRWERAIQAGDWDGILAQHVDDIVMLDAQNRNHRQSEKS